MFEYSVLQVNNIFVNNVSGQNFSKVAHMLYTALSNVRVLCPHVHTPLVSCLAILVGVSSALH